MDEATGTVGDVRKLLNDRYLRIKIRQIIDNVNVFVQKLAQDPGRIARGIIPRNRELPLK